MRSFLKLSIQTQYDKPMVDILFCLQTVRWLTDFDELEQELGLEEVPFPDPGREPKKTRTPGEKIPYGERDKLFKAA
jgi:hypothetical protein